MQAALSSLKEVWDKNVTQGTSALDFFSGWVLKHILIVQTVAVSTQVSNSLTGMAFHQGILRAVVVKYAPPPSCLWFE